MDKLTISHEILNSIIKESNLESPLVPTTIIEAYITCISNSDTYVMSSAMLTKI